jgi:hypothetical protein
VTYNLLEKEWIPVLWSDGEFRRVGIKDALTQAGGIRQIAASNPMDNVALLRFLLAVLQWCKPDVSKEEIAQLLRSETAKGVPDAWLGKLDDNKARFDLLGDAAGFYQDPEALGEVEQRTRNAKRADAQETGLRPATDLMQELPSGTNIAHFRHTRDDRDALCPACCAVGLVRLSAFASASAHGAKQQKPAGINGATPVYGIPMGACLLDTLRINLPLRVPSGDSPWWEDPSRPAKADLIGALRAFTWQPRRVWLERPKAGHDKGVCSACGECYELVRRIVFLPGWKRPFDEKPWPYDPHLLTVCTSARRQSKQPKVDLVKFPSASRPANARAESWRRLHAESWRRLYRGAIQRGASSEDRAAVLAIACSGTAANQAVYKDAISDRCRLPTCGANGEQAGATALRELDNLDVLDPRWILSSALQRDASKSPKALPRNANNRPEIKAALADTAVGTEHALRQRFEQFVEELAEANGDDAVRACTERWRGDVARILEERLTRACRVIVGGSALDRREAIDSIKRELRSAMEKWRDAAPEQPGPVEEHPRASAEKAR